MGLAFGLLFVPVTTSLNLLLPWPLAFRVTLWIFLATYSAALCRWAGAGLMASLFPLVILFASSFWLRSDYDFLCLLILMLGWIRSGLFFRNPGWKALGAEALVGLGGAAMVAFFAPRSMVGWALGVWMFSLVQSLYFVLTDDPSDGEEREFPMDPFEKARRGAEEILSPGG